MLLIRKELKGTLREPPNKKSDTASDATNMLGIVRIRRFKTIIRRVMKFPTNKKTKISA